MREPFLYDVDTPCVMSLLWSNATVSSKVNHGRRCVHGVIRTDNSVHERYYGPFLNTLESGREWDGDGERRIKGGEEWGCDGK